jgi:hypothetical protein
MTDAAAARTPRFSRLDRRKARTRQALVNAAAQLIAQGREDRASIQEITDAAEVFAVCRHPGASRSTRFAAGMPGLRRFAVAHAGAPFGSVCVKAG